MYIIILYTPVKRSSKEYGGPFLARFLIQPDFNAVLEYKFMVCFSIDIMKKQPISFQEEKNH